MARVVSEMVGIGVWTFLMANGNRHFRSPFGINRPFGRLRMRAVHMHADVVQQQRWKVGNVTTSQPISFRDRDGQVLVVVRPPWASSPVAGWPSGRLLTSANALERLFAGVNRTIKARFAAQVRAGDAP